MSAVRTIYAGVRSLGIGEEDERRDLFERVTGKRRLREMSPGDKQAVVDELRRLGFKPAPGGTTGGAHWRPQAGRADLRYCHVLWRLLAEAGAVKVAGARGLNLFVRGRFGAHWGAEPIDFDALRDAGQINDVTRALKDMCRRAGVATNAAPGQGHGQ